MRLKIEINNREHFALDGWQKYPFSISSGWHWGAADITTFTLEKLPATKLRALYQRKNGWDLFDFWRVLSTFNVDPQRIAGHCKE
jgi:predicted nucleotidyltransferase component of viral defense system